MLDMIKFLIKKIRQQTIETNNKIEFVNLLSDSGLQRIEVTSFVSPKWVPQVFYFITQH
jgi:isopropylmalate/homocitrate/citramalate synthase